jgi:hypothetical protein
MSLLKTSDLVKLLPSPESLSMLHKCQEFWDSPMDPSQLTNSPPLSIQATLQITVLPSISIPFQMKVTWPFQAMSNQLCLDQCNTTTLLNRNIGLSNSPLCNKQVSQRLTCQNGKQWLTLEHQLLLEIKLWLTNWLLVSKSTDYARVLKSSQMSPSLLTTSTTYSPTKTMLSKLTLMASQNASLVSWVHHSLLPSNTSFLEITSWESITPTSTETTTELDSQWLLERQP